ncbi:MAG: hypothetical protein HZB56_07665 [Deltaproteobacteria bacterium]|nr:hypothetical protein [Deltaproteobacteria bacterium]
MQRRRRALKARAPGRRAARCVARGLRTEPVADHRREDPARRGARRSGPASTATGPQPPQPRPKPRPEPRFAESKELLGGYVVLELPSLAEARPWALRYGAVVGCPSLDLRPLAEDPPEA